MTRLIWLERLSFLVLLWLIVVSFWNVHQTSVRLDKEDAKLERLLVASCERGNAVRALMNVHLDAGLPIIDCEKAVLHDSG